MRPYTDGPIGPLLYRHSSGVFSLIKSAEPEPGFDLGSTAGESSTLTIHMTTHAILSLPFEFLMEITIC